MDADSPKRNSEGLLVLAVLALCVGAASGLVGALFRVCLLAADGYRDVIITWAGERGVLGCALVVLLCAAAAALAAWLVRYFSPHAAGSGIPHVEAVLDQRLRPAPFALIPVKFVGGVLAMGAGLALGREGPSVQIGSSIAHLASTITRRSWDDCRVLMAAGAGAGLATAFNAPIAGAVFVLEELVRRFETRIAVAALGASAAAMVVARLILGDAPEFSVANLPYPSVQAQLVFLVVGLVAGIVGVLYNHTILGAIRLHAQFAQVPVELRAAAIGGVIGIVAYFAPKLVGGGETLTQQLLGGKTPAAALMAIFAFRFFLGPLSYSARTPGGLFAPMLAVGASLGLLAAFACHQLLPGMELAPEAFAVVAMAAFFTAVVRAPITGITLIIEMTGCFTMLLPTLVASFTAMLLPTLTGNSPIYESLGEKATKG